MEDLDRLEAAVARLRSLESAREDLFQIIREIAPRVRQLDIVERTGWTREYIRRIAASEPPAGKQ